MDDLLMTSGYNFEGYKIKKYIGFCSGECVLGTGFLSSLGAGLADFLGSNSSMYEGKLYKAKNMAISDLISTAKNLGANAVIGLDVDYTTFTSDIMGVIANGTAVYIEPEHAESTAEISFSTSLSQADDKSKEKIINIPVINYYTDISVRPFMIKYNISAHTVKLQLCKYNDLPVTALNLSFIFNTIFGTTAVFEDINFTDISVKENYLETEYVPLSIPLNTLKIINSCTVSIHHYLEDKVCYTPDSPYRLTVLEPDRLTGLRNIYGSDVVSDYAVGEDHWLCLCGMENPLYADTCCLCGRSQNAHQAVSSDTRFPCTFIQTAEDLSSALEIKKYIDSVADNQLLPDALLNEIDKLTKYERLYGNMKDSCIKIIKQYLQAEK